MQDFKKFKGHVTTAAFDIIPSLLLEIQFQLSPLLLRDAKLTGHLVHHRRVAQQFVRVAKVVDVLGDVVDGLVEDVAVEVN